MPMTWRKPPLAAMLLGGLGLLLSVQARAQIISEVQALYEPAQTPATPRAMGLTVLALFDDPGYASAVFGLAQERVPLSIIGSDRRSNLLASCPAGLLSLSPTGQNCLRLTSTSLEDGGVAGGLSQVAATVDELGWLYLAHPLRGLVRLAVTKEPVQLYGPEALAEAAYSALAPGILDVEVFGERLFLAAGESGLLAAQRSGAGVERIYDPFIDAESAGLSGMEAGLMAISATPAGEPVLAVSAGGATWVAVMIGAELRGVGEGALLDAAVIPGGLAHMGDGGYLLLSEEGLHWFNLAGFSMELGDPGDPLLALRSVGMSQAGEARLLAAFDGCGGRAFLRTEAGLLTLSTQAGELRGGDVIVALPDQQSIVRLIAATDPVPLWSGAPLVGPRDVAIDPQARVWVVDAGAQTIFRLEGDASNLLSVRGPGGSPWALSFDRQGRPILADFGIQDEDGVQLPGVVRLHLSDDEEVVLARGDPIESPADLMVDANDRILVADSSANRIWILENQAGATLVPLAEVESPRALALGEGGLLYVLSLPEHTQPGLYEVAADGSVSALLIGEPLVQPTGLLRLPGGQILVADARSDPFPGPARASSDTGGLYLVDPVSREVRPYLDSWLIRRNPQGITLCDVPGARPADCLLGPTVRPPVEDPYVPPEEDGSAEEDEDEEGCGCHHRSAGTSSPRGEGLLLLLLPGLLALLRTCGWRWFWRCQ